MEYIVQQIEKAEVAVGVIEDFGSAENREVAKELLFLARVKEVKRLYSNAEKEIRFLCAKYKKELSYSKTDIFPRKWMTQDRKINSIIERYPLLMPLLNYTFNLTRKPTKDELAYMDEINDVVYTKYPVSVFIADNEFYSKVMEKLGCSKRSIQKYLKCLTKEIEGIFIPAGRLHHGVKIIADGYYTQSGGMRVKHPFLKNNSYYRTALRNFKSV